ncbi:amino acid ABC transporter ATP-binding protein [Saccharibacillus kuerlensis]|uniref:Polar amino acid ABC transporter ATP-binding protein n=1 Tax=Saccharibacillus kuerlensis TaxID=459527 RepID=A0ABQ2L4B1_9BACL|nr:polar amino acid ABC transporter ATP-binding protein [Saccharibacillus kuerlensis]
MKEMIRLEGLVKSFGDLKVLKGIDLVVQESEVVCLVGASGSGKSTLLRCLNFLEENNGGKIYIEGKAVDPKNDDLNKIREKVGMVFQHFNLFPHMTVLENVIEAPVQVKKVPKEQAIREAKELLLKVGLEEKEDVYPGKLSGGQKQRVAIARALAMKPDIMLFDEATSALDPELVEEVLRTMRGLAEEGMTMVVVTHEMNFAREVADTVVFLHDGNIIEKAPAEQFFTNPQQPQTQSFLQTAVVR